MKIIHFVVFDVWCISERHQQKKRTICHFPIDSRLCDFGLIPNIPMAKPKPIQNKTKPRQFYVGANNYFEYENYREYIHWTPRHIETETIRRCQDIKRKKNYRFKNRKTRSIRHNNNNQNVVLKWNITCYMACDHIIVIWCIVLFHFYFQSAFSRIRSKKQIA